MIRNIHLGGCMPPARPNLDFFNCKVASPPSRTQDGKIQLQVSLAGGKTRIICQYDPSAPRGNLTAQVRPAPAALDARQRAELQRAVLDALPGTADPAEREMLKEIANSGHAFNNLAYGGFENGFETAKIFGHLRRGFYIEVSFDLMRQKATAELKFNGGPQHDWFVLNKQQSLELAGVLRQALARTQNAEEKTVLQGALEILQAK